MRFIHFMDEKVLMKYRLQKITSWFCHLLYDTVVGWGHHGLVPQDEIHAQADEEMERVSLKFTVEFKFAFRVIDVACEVNIPRENNFEREKEWRRIIIVIILSSLSMKRGLSTRESEGETREDVYSADVYLDDNQIAKSIGTRIREQMWFPQGLTVQSGRSGACGFQAELQGNGDDRDNHRRS